jgi:hypothetical protein
MILVAETKESFIAGRAAKRPQGERMPKEPLDEAVFLNEGVVYLLRARLPLSDRCEFLSQIGTFRLGA